MATRANVRNLYGKTNERAFSTIQMNEQTKKIAILSRNGQFLAKLKRLYVLPRNDVVITKCDFSCQRNTTIRGK